MTQPAELQAAYDLLRSNGVDVDAATFNAAQQALAAAGPVNRCVRCGATDEDNEDAGYGPLTDVTVIFSIGEEGFAEERRFVCNDHGIEYAETMIRLGFGSHRHGGINWLEVTDCPGAARAADCPTPQVRD